VIYSSIILTNPQFGEIQYDVSGVGLLPGIMPTVLVDAQLGEIGSQTIIFRNPFAHPLPLDILLTNNNVQSDGNSSINSSVRGKQDPLNALKEKNAKEAMLQAFALLSRKTTDLVIPAKSQFHISLSFTPLKLGQYEAIVQARSSVSGRNLLWCYPVKGIAEAGTAQRLPILKTPCKTQTMREDLILLEGISKSDIQSLNDLKLSDFTVELKIDEKYKTLVTRAFRAQPLEIIALPEKTGKDSYYPAGRNPPEFGMRLRLLFEPLRTLTTRIEVAIICKNRGKWRVQVDLDATEPDADDKIKLVAPVGGADKITFRLTNRFLGYSKFHAFFSSKSSPHFNVLPTSGVLAPYGSEGTAFVVTFAPADYGTIEMYNLFF
jgi:hypothetical protein